jgi:hypothetical protein
MENKETIVVKKEVRNKFKTKLYYYEISIYIFMNNLNYYCNDILSNTDDKSARDYFYIHPVVIFHGIH